METELKKITPAEIDKIVCQWSMDKGVALTEEQQISIVDRLSILVLGESPMVDKFPN
jgi:hypothetical protein